MKKLNDFVARFGTDRVLHFLVAAWFVSQFEIFGIWWVILSLPIVFGLSILKEKKFDESADKKDIIFAMAGAIFEFLSYILRSWIF